MPRNMKAVCASQEQGIRDNGIQTSPQVIKQFLSLHKKPTFAGILADTT